MGADRLGHVLEASMKTCVSQARAAISSPSTSRHVVRGRRAAHESHERYVEGVGAKLGAQAQQRADTSCGQRQSKRVLEPRRGVTY